MITKEELLNNIEYNPETGKFFWKKTKQGRNKDLSAGGKDKDGYIAICINGSQYKAHRLAWIIYHGFAPTEQIDHINKITSDNRICNLRLASQTENNCNQKISYKIIVLILYFFDFEKTLNKYYIKKRNVI